MRNWPKPILAVLLGGAVTVLGLDITTAFALNAPRPAAGAPSPHVAAVVSASLATVTARHRPAALAKPAGPGPVQRTAAHQAEVPRTVAVHDSQPMAAPSVIGPPTIPVPAPEPAATPAPIPTTTVTAIPAPPPTVAPAPLPPAPQLARPQLAARPDPRASISPPVGFTSLCVGSQSLKLCDPVALVAIDLARVGEGLGPLLLPANFETLDVVSQLMAVTNAERTSRGLPALAANGTLDQLAATGARAGTDPTGPAGHGWGSNISWNYNAPLAADFAWMYDDGPGGNNIACPATGGAGCWGHRNNILSPWGGAMGAAAFASGGLRFTTLMVDGY